MREIISNDMTNLVNKKVVGGNEFHTNDIWKPLNKAPQDPNIWWKVLRS